MSRRGGGLSLIGRVPSRGVMPVSVDIHGNSAYVLNAGGVANVAAFREGRGWLSEVLAYIRGNAVWLDQVLRRDLPEVGYRPPEATYFAWLDLRAFGLPADPGQYLLDRAGVAVSSGPAFGPGGEGHVRLNLATTRAILAAAVERIAGAVQGAVGRAGVTRPVR